jgi:sugar lactone lactonase YvrE
LQPGEGWEIAADGCSRVTTLASDPQGQIFYRSGTVQKIAQIGKADHPAPCHQGGDSASFAFGPRGKLYVARAEGGLEVRANSDEHRPAKVLAEGLHIQSFTVRSNGDIYATVEPSNGESELWLVPSSGKKVRLDEGLKGASGVALTPDGLWLFVTQRLSQAGLSYRVRSDGTLDSREPLYSFNAPIGDGDSGATEIAMDRDGRAYVATRMGIQIFDRNGRVTAILPLPGNAPATGVCFGGPDFNTLYVAAGGQVYRRNLRIAGAPPWASPTKLPPWGAG